MLKELLESSDPINMPLLIKTVTVANTQKGEPYVRATVGDTSASVQAIHFSVSDKQMELWEIDTVIKITGGVEEYQGNKQIKVSGVSKVKGDVDPADFYECCSTPIDDLWKEFIALIDEVRGPITSVDDTTREFKLAATIIAWTQESPELWDNFKKAPAAKVMHHSYVGGLLEHSIGTAKIAKQLVAGRPHIDSALTILGALIHDIGKTWEYTLGGDLTSMGKLQGHLFMGAQIADFIFTKHKIYVSSADRSILTHIILSHHGKQEWGAIVPPKTPEAWIVHMADTIDVRLWCADKHRPDEGWSWERIKTWDNQEVLLSAKDEE